MTNAPPAPTDPIAPPGGWARVASPRLRPPPPSERGLVFRFVALFSRFFRRPEVPDVFPLINLDRRIFLPWLAFASRLMPFGRLPAVLRELVILRTAWSCRSRYEWGQHVDVALGAGVAPADILRAAEAAPRYDDPIAQALIEACDQLCAQHFVDDATWETLRARFHEAELVELAFLVGHYRMLAGLLNSAGLVLEPALEAKLQAFYREHAPAGAVTGR